MRLGKQYLRQMLFLPKRLDGLVKRTWWKRNVPW